MRAVRSGYAGREVGASEIEAVERDREEIEILLRSSDKQDIECALLSAAYCDPVVMGAGAVSWLHFPQRLFDMVGHTRTFRA